MSILSKPAPGPQTSLRVPSGAKGGKKGAKRVASVGTSV